MGGSISAKANSIMGLLGGDHRYEVGAYQREYTWGSQQVRALIDDLTRAFHGERGGMLRKFRFNERPEYFLGPFVYYDGKFGRRLLVDGQQRFVTLNLLLLHLQRMVDPVGEKGALGMLARVIHRNDGESFSVGITDHVPVLKAIADGRDYDAGYGESLSRRNLWARSVEIEASLRSEVSADELGDFVSWLLNRVTMVAIRAPGEGSGYRIFETMNDRGARLTTVDLLKSYLISSAGSQEGELNKAWRAMLSELAVDREDFGAPARFLKAALLAHHASLEGPGDQAEIENNINSWVRRNENRLGLDHRPRSYVAFVEGLIQLAHLARPVLAASRTLTEGHEVFYFNERNGLGAQLIAVLAAIKPDDVPRVALEKAVRVGRFLDRWYALRILDDLPVHTAAVDELVHRVLVPALRPCQTADEVTKALGACIEEASPLDFPTFGLRANNRRHVHYLLARAAAFVDQGCGRTVDVAAYVDSERFQIEHLWSRHYEQVRADIKDPLLFRTLRERLGGLGLLPGPTNAAFNDLPLARKLDLYKRENILLGGLAPNYDMRNKPLRDFIKAHGLTGLLRPIGGKIRMKELVERRQSLYLAIFTAIWDPWRLQITDREPPVPEPAATPATSQSRAGARREDAKARVKIRNTDLGKMLKAGVVEVGTPIVLTHGTDHWLSVRADGSVQLSATGDVYGKVDDAGCAIKNTKSCKGMDECHVERDGHRISLRDLRDQARKAGLLQLR